MHPQIAPVMLGKIFCGIQSSYRTWHIPVLTRWHSSYKLPGRGLLTLWWVVPRPWKMSSSIVEIARPNYGTLIDLYTNFLNKISPSFALFLLLNLLACISILWPSAFQSSADFLETDRAKCCVHCHRHSPTRWQRHNTTHLSQMA